MEVPTSVLCRVLDYAEQVRRAASASVFGWIGTPHIQSASLMLDAGAGQG